MRDKTAVPARTDGRIIHNPKHPMAMRFNINLTVCRKSNPRAKANTRQASTRWEPA